MNFFAQKVRRVEISRGERKGLISFVESTNYREKKDPLDFINQVQFKCVISVDIWNILESGSTKFFLVYFGFKNYTYEFLSPSY